MAVDTAVEIDSIESIAFAADGGNRSFNAITTIDNAAIYLVDSTDIGSTDEPTAAPTATPTATPTTNPTAAPTSSPTSSPTAAPTLAPVDGRGNMAAGKSVTASSNIGSLTWDTAFLTDGITDDNKGWSSNTGNNLNQTRNEWIIIDLGGICTFDQIKLYPRVNNGGYAFPIDFTINVSDDNMTWEKIVEKKGYPVPVSGVQEFDVGEQTGRYVKIDCTKMSNEGANSAYYRMQLCEVEIIGEVIVPTSVTLDKNTADMKPTTSLKLTATLAPEKASAILTWESSEPSVATVNSTGVVTALKEGDTVVTVTTDNGLKDSCRIHVVESKIYVENAYSTIHNEDETVTFVLDPSKVLNKDVKDNDIEFVLAAYNSDGTLIKVSTAPEIYSYYSYYDEANAGRIKSDSEMVILDNVAEDSIIKLLCWGSVKSMMPVNEIQTVYNYVWENPTGYPREESDALVLSHFMDPPDGYGEVGFYWWSGKDPIDIDRIKWQLERLKDGGVSGMQVNYFHTASGGNSRGLTYQSDPALFTDEWWDIYGEFMEEADKQGIAVSLSDYTLCTPGQGYYTDEIIKENPEMMGMNLLSGSADFTGGTTITWNLPAGGIDRNIKVVAYKIGDDNAIVPGTAVDLAEFVSGNTVSWAAPDGKWRLINIYYSYVSPSLDPMNPLTGQKIIEKFFEPFEEKFPNSPGRALNFFFSDEFELGIKGNLWNQNFLEEFEKRKGYDLLDGIEGIFYDIGSSTEKIRLDYNDVLVSLSEEGTYIPIYNWHKEKGILYGCDHSSRGSNPIDYGDYFRIIRWYTGPGNDQPNLGSDIIRTKVTSSISHLYDRPRTWLEGYYGSGWGTNTDQLVDATFKNFAMGSNLLTLHGLYYSTYGGYMEWAPPDNHIHMPYWDHMKTFMKTNERLSYLLSQGEHRCDIAVMYPVAPLAAGAADGEVSKNVSFDTMRYLYGEAMDADFIDAQSIDRAETDSENSALTVSGEQYKVLILPSMRVINYSNIEKIEEFYKNGGTIISIGALPAISDRVGRDDEELNAKIKEVFGYTSEEAEALTSININEDASGGRGIIIPMDKSQTTISDSQKQSLADTINSLIQPDFKCLSSVSEQPSILHRVIGSRDVYMVYGAPKNAECEFRAKGNVELWDPWTGEQTEIFNTIYENGVTKVRMPLSEKEIQLIVFTATEESEKAEVVSTDLTDITAIKQDGDSYQVEGYSDNGGSKETVIRVNNKDVKLMGNSEEKKTINLDNSWRFEIKPCLDNTWGDFRLPATDELIGAEARSMKYMQETEDGADYSAPGYNDSSWSKYTYSYGGKFWKLGPLPNNVDMDEVEKAISQYSSIDPSVPVVIGGKNYYWQVYSYSDRLGVEGYPGIQGYHGLKGSISDDFILLGRVKVNPKSETFLQEAGASGTRYFLWTSFDSEKDQTVKVNKSGLSPAKVWVNGENVDAGSTNLQVQQGNNSMLLRYDNVGRGCYLLETDEVSSNWKQEYPLAMTSYKKPGVLSYDIYPDDETPAGWYRFTSAPGMKEMTIVSMGTPEVWANGEKLDVELVKENDDGSAEYKAVCGSVIKEAVKVAMRIEQVKGCYGGGALVEPVKFTCEEGEIKLGDWSTMGEALYSYSGGAYYRKSVNLTKDQIGTRMILNLGEVISTAEVKINGETVATKVSAPWTVDVSGYLNEGDNEIEILVYNTLSNHYTTIPTDYRGSLKSGLIGPVSITSQNITVQK